MINRGFFVGNTARLCTGVEPTNPASWLQVDLGSGPVDPETEKPRWTLEAVVAALQALGHAVPDVDGWEPRGNDDSYGWCVKGPATGA